MQRQVLEELKTYDSKEEPDYTSWLRNRKKQSLCWWTTCEVFLNSGVTILTNGMVYCKDDASKFLNFIYMSMSSFAEKKIKIKNSHANNGLCSTGTDILIPCLSPRVQCIVWSKSTDVSPHIGPGTHLEMG